MRALGRSHRSDVSRTRTEVAATVTSSTTHNEQNEQIAVKMNPTAKEIIGIRRRYHDALEANVEARARYQRACIRVRDLPSPQAQQVPLREDDVLAHLESAGLEKQHQELEVRCRYVQSLSQDASDICDLSISQLEPRNGSIDEKGLGDQITTSVAEIESSISNLDKAILQADHQLKRQNALLAETKHADNPPSSALMDCDARGRAIAAMKDIQILWLDEKLSDIGADSAQHQEILPREADWGVSHSVNSIPEHYQIYLDARRAVVEAAEEVLRPLPAQPQIDGAPTTQADVLEESTNRDDLSVVHATSQHLLTLLRQRVDTSVLQSYFSAQTAKEGKNILEGLERLADESHIMSTFLNGKGETGDGLSRSIASWRYAAREETESSMKVFGEHERASRQAFTNGEEALMELKSYVDDDDAFASRGVEG